MTAKSKEQPIILQIISALTKRSACKHTGQSGEYCADCGKDIRVTTSYECRLCSMLNRPATFTADRAPDFCPRCGAPKFTFRDIKKKKSR